MKAACLLFAITLTAAAQSSEYENGRRALEHGNADEAITWLEKAVLRTPNSARYHYELGNAYALSAMQGSTFRAMSTGSKAKKEWQRALELDPNFLPARFTLLDLAASAPVFVGGGDAAAMAQADEIRKRDAIDGHRAFGRIFVLQKKFDQARAEYGRLVAEQPASARAHYHYGVYLLLTEKKYTSAIDEFEKALKLDPSYMPPLFRIGHAAAISGDRLERGEEALKRYLAYRPK